MSRAHAIRTPVRARRRTASRRSALAIWRRRLVALLLLSLLFIAGYMLWFRDSSLVAVKRVSVNGARGPEAARIKGSLARAAADMTTLHVRKDLLNQAVASFPLVKAVTARPNFPNGLTIDVTLQEPAVIVEAGGRHVAAAADGTLLPGVPGTRGLPVLRLTGSMPATRLTGDPLQQALVLGATPRELRPYVTGVKTVSGGVRLEMRGGPEIRFGDATSLRAKWLAATRMLSDQTVKGAGYVDVSAPERPAVGGIVQAPAGAPAVAAPATG